MTEPGYEILVGDVVDRLGGLADGSVRCCVTSPPYWGLRDYGAEGQIGLEATPEAFVDRLVGVFRAVRRVLADDGSLWLNMGDCYAGSWSGNSMRPEGGSQRPGAPGFQPLDDRVPSRNGVTPDGCKPKDMVGVPWLLAFALRADGWYLRSDIIWAKPNPMPESVTDRPTKSHEHIFLLTKNQRYYYDAAAIAEPAAGTGGGASFGKQNHDAAGTGAQSRTYDRPEYATRNSRDVWTITTQPYPEAHFATFPLELPMRCIKAGTSERGGCPSCGAAWERVTETSKSFESGSGKSGNPINGKQDLSAAQSNSTPDIRMGPTTHTRTTGWKPGCACGLDPVPDTVLDPFGGSGTTGEAAVLLGRRAVLCELNPEYARLAEKRVGRAVSPATWRSDEVGEAPLFVDTRTEAMN